MCTSRDAPSVPSADILHVPSATGQGARVSALMNKQTTVCFLFRVSCLP